jgi:nicotinamidase-related amidase
MPQFTVLPANKTALLIIDVQRALFTRPTHVYQDSRMLETINGVVDLASLYHVPVIYIQHSNQSILKEGSDGFKLHPALRPGPDDFYVTKKHGNAFQDTTLRSILESRGLEYLVVTGMVTQGCIRATSLGGVKLGYKMFLVRGAHSNYNVDAPAIIEKYEEELGNAGVNLVNFDELAFG